MSGTSSRIKARRIELGLTQSELAELAGYADRSMISKIEKGDIDLSLGRLNSLATALNTTTEYLYGYVDNASDPVLNSKLIDTFRTRVAVALENANRVDIEAALGTCSLYENILEKGYPISLDMAYDIADKLGVSLDYLTGLTDTEEDCDRKYFLSHSQYQHHLKVVNPDEVIPDANPTQINGLLDVLLDIGALNSDGSVNEEGMSLIIDFIKQNAIMLRKMMPSASDKQLTNFTLGRIHAKQALKPKPTG